MYSINLNIIYFCKKKKIAKILNLKRKGCVM